MRVLPLSSHDRRGCCQQRCRAIGLGLEVWLNLA